MSDFPAMLDDAHNQDPMPDQRGLLVTIGVGALIILIVLTVVLTVVVGKKSNPRTVHDNAQALCTPSAPVLHMMGDGIIAYKLPDVGKPLAVIVVPACLQVAQIPRNQRGHYVSEITIYIMLSSTQMTSLLGQQQPSNTPIGVDDTVIGALVSKQQRAAITRGAQPGEISYYVTDGPAPTERLRETRGYSFSTAPFDIMTGTRFTSLPFRQAREINSIGEPILIGGS